MDKNQKPLKERFKELTTPKELIEAEDCFESKIKLLKKEYQNTLETEQVEITHLFIITTDNKSIATIQPNKVTNDNRSII